jgi:hypothetical protein
MLDGRKLTSAAADEVDDLDAVARREFQLAPTRPTHYFAIDLDGDAFRRERELSYQFGDRRAVLDLTLFTVDDYLQSARLSCDE